MKTLKECEDYPLEVTVSELYNILFDYQRESRLGIIRFPKRIRNLYRKVYWKFGESKGEITSKMIDILHNKDLNYCHKKISNFVNQEENDK